MAAGDPTPAQPGMVQCEITGQWVPEDEVIIIQGHRVCAEGKAELLERLKAGELLAGELERPTALRRFACMFVDGLVLGVVNLALGFVTVGASGFAAVAAGDLAALGVGFVVWQLLYTLIMVGYFTLMHGNWGQTLGKMAGRVKVVKPDGTPISMGTAFARCLILYGPSAIVGIIIVLAALGQSLPTMHASNLANIAVSIYFFASCVTALVDRAQQRAIHDRLAKTRVIRLD